MKTIHLLLLLTLFCCVSCSKSEERALARKNKEIRTALLGSWKLVKQHSDMGPIDWPSSYRRILTFYSNFTYTDSTLNLDDPAHNKGAKRKYKVEFKDQPTQRVNYYVFLNPSEILPCGYFIGSQNDTLLIFNGVGGEYYIKHF